MDQANTEPDTAASGLEASTIGAQLRDWFAARENLTIGGLVDVFGEKSFAVLFVVLLGVPALPLPTGGLTHVFEVAAVLLALQMIVGREEVWLPRRWRALELGGERSNAFVDRLVRVIEWVERRSRPRMRRLFSLRGAPVVHGLLTILFAVAAFLAPPFSGLDTLPALAAVLLALAVVFEDIVLALIATALGAIGIVLEVALGAAAVHGLSSLL